MPMYDYKYLLDTATVAADGTYTANEINFGVTNPNIGGTGKFGLHIIVTTAFANATEGMYCWVFHGAATTPTTRLVGRFFSLASLTAGKHYFIPMPKTLLQYARAGWVKHTTDEATGVCTIYFGPDEDGAE